MKHLSHDLSKKFREAVGEWHINVGFEALKEELNALEEVDECRVVSHNIPCCL
jgi:hypothetical protein